MTHETTRESYDPGIWPKVTLCIEGYGAFTITTCLVFKKTLKSMVVYQFTCAGYNSCYIGQTSRHFSTRIKEHTVSDKNSHIFKNFSQFPSCRACTHLIFVSWTQLIALLIFYISKNKPDLNKQLHHFNTFNTVISWFTVLLFML